ncbi:heparan-alpha-glucosaminide N-acetyltransferase domain-containing protein [Bacillus suaedae]|uniref:DUF1624 domain-containing protein n=1 Tax=Halalkalibacter suaedae TaxID=2822140 RepID=A0A940WSY8_9BACI|nr:heparan-alpha-glucosaminide N-acetyltransferase domain-containing protein [Bacillus suaedae]MBP3950072.1 DUF1624 domain-containing protein [Bacillus suaedae]
MIQKRIESIDVLRGFVVVLSVFVSALPYGGYPLFRHAEWYGLTITDFIFPAFLTLFGVGLAIANFKGVNWKKLMRRTFLLLLFGLLFNMIVSWSIDIHNLRFTGVLQLFAIAGLFTILLTRLVTRIPYILLLSISISTLYLFFLIGTSQTCGGLIPQADCLASFKIDRFLFTDVHLYRAGSSGFDPEGFVNMISALTNVLAGYAIGLILIRKDINKKTMTLLLIGGLFILIGCVFSQWIDFNKRIWSPSFSLVTTGMTLFLLGCLYWLIDKKNFLTKQNPVVVYLTAFGKNSLLIYFGKLILLTFVSKITLNVIGMDSTIADVLHRFVPSKVGYAFLFVLFWSVVAIIMHLNKKYVKV